MQVLFKRLRHRGVKLTQREVDATPWTVAHMETGRSGCLQMRRLAAAPDMPPIAELHQARVKQANQEGMILLGIEQSGNAAVVQEWLLKAPPDLGGDALTSPRAANIIGWTLAYPKVET
jgi:hypothetical protein